jgi:hypothetical protein
VVDGSDVGNNLHRMGNRRSDHLCNRMGCFRKGRSTMVLEIVDLRSDDWNRSLVDVETVRSDMI